MLLHLIFSFISWNLFAYYTLPLYAKIIAIFTTSTLSIFQNQTFVLLEQYPNVVWKIEGIKNIPELTQTSFRLLSYNWVIYLTVLSAWSGPSAKYKLVLFILAFPAMVFFHSLDLLLVIKSKTLSAEGLSSQVGIARQLWFSVVKFSHSFSVLAFKQVFPLLLLLLQWYFFRRIFPQRAIR